MRFLKPILILATVLGVAWAVWFYFFPPPEKVIRQRLEKLAVSVSEKPGGNIARVANVNRIGSFFHPNVSIRIEALGREMTIQGRGELEQSAMAARQNVNSIAVDLYNIQIELGLEKTNASALATALVKINDQHDPAVQELRFDFEKLDRQWLIRAVGPATLTKEIKVE